MLGSYIMSELCGGDRSDTSIADLVRNAVTKSKGKQSSPEFGSWISEWLKAHAPQSTRPAHVVQSNWRLLFHTLLKEAISGGADG
jgi:hypothetical protein